MLAYILAIAVGIGSFALYMAAFLFPKIHRKDDFLWSGVGLFYALVLWVSAGRITGGVLLGQLAGVSLLGWFAVETLKLRGAIAYPERQIEIEDFSLIDWLQNRFEQFTSRFRQQKPQPEVVKTDAVVDSPIDTTTPVSADGVGDSPIDTTTPISATITETISSETPEIVETETVTEVETETKTETVMEETVKEEPKTKKNPLKKVFGGITKTWRKQKPSKTEAMVETPKAETSSPTYFESQTTIQTGEISATSPGETEEIEQLQSIQDQDTLILSPAQITSKIPSETIAETEAEKNQDTVIQLPKISESEKIAEQEKNVENQETVIQLPKISESEKIAETEQEKARENQETFIQLPQKTSEENLSEIDEEIGGDTLIQNETLIQISEPSEENTSEQTYSSLEQIAGAETTETSDQKEEVVEPKTSTRNIQVSTQLVQELIEAEDLPADAAGENLSSSIEEILEAEQAPTDPIIDSNSTENNSSAVEILEEKVENKKMEKASVEDSPKTENKE